MGCWDIVQIEGKGPGRVIQDVVDLQIVVSNIVDVEPDGLVITISPDMPDAEENESFLQLMYGATLLDSLTAPLSEENDFVTAGDSESVDKAVMDFRKGFQPKLPP